VLVIALLVHASILTHTTWFSAYWEGGHKTHVSMVTPAPNTANFASR
jgi:hypothetical protein